MIDSTGTIQTVDGVDANALWAEYQASLTEYNSEYNALISQLTFNTTQQNFQVIQGTYEFEQYADYTLPDVHDLETYSVSIPINDWDLRIAYTFARILETSRQEMDARHAEALAADVRLQFRQVLKAVFTKEGVYYNGILGTPLYNNDGFVPPPWKNNTFAGTHTHYLADEIAHASTLLPACVDTLLEHGFEQDLVALCNRHTARQLATQLSTAWIVPIQPGSDLTKMPAPGGSEVLGWYDSCTFIREDWIPDHYFFMFSRQGGSGSQQNTVAFRESTSAAARGLILMRGSNPEYPLVNSFYYRKFGCAVRQRGNGVCAFIDGSATYTSPTF